MFHGLKKNVEQKTFAKKPLFGSNYSVKQNGLSS